MTRSIDPLYDDLLTGEVSATRDHLIHDLAHAYHPSPAPSQLDAAIMPALRKRSTATRRKRAWMGRLIRSRIAGVAAACAVVLGGSLAYRHGQSAAPVSAQTILSRSAAAGLVPNEVTHFTYRLTASNGYTGTSDEWVQADSSGAASRLVLSNRVMNGATSVPSLDERLVQSGDTVQVYDPASNTVTVSPSDQVDQPWEAIVVGTRLAQKLSSGPKSAGPLQKGTPAQQTLDGVSVYVLPLSSTDRTLYVDARSYVPRGADWSENGVSWHARLLRYDTVAASTVPAGTLSLNAPPTATWIQTQPDKSDYPVDLSGALAQACNTTPAAFKGAWGRSPDQSMLAICQETNPSETSTQLDAALLASTKAQLDAAVAAGKITAAQAADQLARMQAKVDSSAASPGGPKAPPK